MGVTLHNPKPGAARAEDGFQPERQSLVAVFAGELPAQLLLKKASRMRILTGRGEAIDIHYPPEPAFL